jgi:hypothetical protein
MPQRHARDTNAEESHRGPQVRRPVEIAVANAGDGQEWFRQRASGFHGRYGPGTTGRAPVTMNPDKIPPALQAHEGQRDDGFRAQPRGPAMILTRIASERRTT